MYKVTNFSEPSHMLFCGFASLVSSKVGIVELCVGCI